MTEVFQLLNYSIRNRIIQEKFLLRFDTENPFQNRILNGEKIPPQRLLFFLRYKIQRYRIPVTEVLEPIVPFERNRIVFGG